MIPFIEVSGTHKEMGFQTGKKIATLIKTQISVADKYYKKEHKRSLRSLHEIAQQFLPPAQRYFPQYVMELKAIASGAGVAFGDVLVLMCDEEVENALTGRMAEKCTTIATCWESNYYLAHNEDYSPSSLLYVVKAKPKSEPPYISLAYAGRLAGSSAAMTPFLAFGGNVLNVVACKQGVPVNFLLRAMCAQKTKEDITALWGETPHAIGNNSLFVTKDGIYDLEITPAKNSLVHASDVLFHTNHIVHPSLQKIKDVPTESSLKRYSWLRQHVKKQLSPQQIIAALSSHTASVCRHDGESVTLATALFDFTKQQLVLYKGNPCRKKRKKFML